MKSSSSGASEASRKWARENPDRVREFKKAAYWRDPEKHRENCRRRYRANKEARKAHAKKYYQKNKERILALGRIYADAHPEFSRKARKNWKLRNPEHLIADKARRRAAEISAIPAWANLDAIKSFYAEARILSRMMGIKYHVDHLVPLRSRWVCGLHCEDNLDLVPAAVNSKKSNVYWPGMPEGLEP